MKNTDGVRKILAWVDRDTLPETPPNYPPMASWPGFGDTGRIKAAWRRSLRLDGGRRPVVYVHVPFCETLCKFCGFYKLPAAPGAIDRYLDALEKEACMLGPLFKGRPLRSLCIGGGTPSLLSLAQLRRLFSLLRARFKITAGAKIAFESSPNTLDASKLAFLKSAGVEWLAIGVQSFDAHLLNAMKRRQDPVQVMEIIKQAKKAGIGQVEVDLMAGLPGQTRKSFLADVEKVAALDLERIFLFEFQPKCGTAVAEKGGSLSAPFLEDVRGWRRAGMDILLKHGYSAACGYWLCKRNGGSWPYSYDQGEDGSYSVLGLGPSAISYAMNAARYRNVQDEPAYEKELSSGRLPAGTGCFVGKREEMVNFVILDALHRGQIDKRAFRKRFSVELLKAFPGRLGRLAAAGILADSSRLMLVADRGRATFELRKALYSPEVLRRLSEHYGVGISAPAAGESPALPSFNRAAGQVYECQLSTRGDLSRLLGGSGERGPEKSGRKLLAELRQAVGAGRTEAMLICGEKAGPGRYVLAVSELARAAGFKSISVFSRLPADASFFKLMRAVGVGKFLTRFDSGISGGSLENISAAAEASLKICAVNVLGAEPPGRLLRAMERLRARGVKEFILAFPQEADNIASDYSALRPLVEVLAGQRGSAGPGAVFLGVPLCILYPHLALAGDRLLGVSGNARESGGAARALKPKLCLHCRFLLNCPGPTYGYTQKFGMKALRAIK